MSDSVARRGLARAAARLAAASPRPGLSPPLVLMSDDERLADPCAAAALLPRGSMVIARARKTAQRAKLVLALGAIVRRRGLVLLVAGEMLPGADGIHLPEARTGEAPYWRARFPQALITASAHSPAALARAQAFRVDAVFLSAIFPDAKPSRPRGTDAASRRADGATNARACLRSGWDRCAQCNAAHRHAFCRHCRHRRARTVI